MLTRTRVAPHDQERLWSGYTLFDGSNLRKPRVRFVKPCVTSHHHKLFTPLSTDNPFSNIKCPSHSTKASSHPIILNAFVATLWMLRIHVPILRFHPATLTLGMLHGGWMKRDRVFCASAVWQLGICATMATFLAFT